MYKPTLKKLLILFLLVFHSALLLAQSGKLTSRITDAKGQAIIGTSSAVYATLPIMPRAYFLTASYKF